MMMQNKGVADIVSSFDERLVVSEFLETCQSTSVQRKGFKKSQMIPGCLTQYHQEEDFVCSPHHNFEDLPHL